MGLRTGRLDSFFSRDVIGILTKALWSVLGGLLSGQALVSCTAPRLLRSRFPSGLFPRCGPRAQRRPLFRLPSVSHEGALCQTTEYERR